MFLKTSARVMLLSIGMLAIVTVGRLSAHEEAHPEDLTPYLSEDDKMALRCGEAKMLDIFKKEGKVLAIFWNVEKDYRFHIQGPGIFNTGTYLNPRHCLKRMLPHGTTYRLMAHQRSDHTLFWFKKHQEWLAVGETIVQIPQDTTRENPTVTLKLTAEESRRYSNNEYLRINFVKLLSYLFLIVYFDLAVSLFFTILVLWLSRFQLRIMGPKP